MIVLGVAVSTMESVTKSLEQSADTERSTQLFFASEAGIEAAFFHHDARGQGVQMTGDQAGLKLSLPGTSAKTLWSIVGRSQLKKDDNTTPVFAGILKEFQTISIPLSWDVSTTSTAIKDKQKGVDGTTAGNDDLLISFFNEPSDAGDNNIENYLKTLLGENARKSSEIDFGKDSTDGDEILIDWAFSRKHSVKGIQTFSPIERNDCTGTEMGFICEGDVSNSLTTFTNINTKNSVHGRILPGNISYEDDNTITLDNFFECDDSTVGAGESCSDYKIMIRSLLKYEDSGDSTKRIAGIPFFIEEISNGGTDLPKDSYLISSSVTMGDFVQDIELKIPERTAIGAFDYVIFD